MLFGEGNHDNSSYGNRREGTLKLDENLPFADDTRVAVTVEPLTAKAKSLAAWESFKARLRERPILQHGKHFTREELHERR